MDAAVAVHFVTWAQKHSPQRPKNSVSQSKNKSSVNAIGDVKLLV